MVLTISTFVFELKWNRARWCNYDGIDFWFNLVKCRTSKTKIYFEYISGSFNRFKIFQKSSKFNFRGFNWPRKIETFTSLEHIPDIRRSCPTPYSHNQLHKDGLTRSNELAIWLALHRNHFGLLLREHMIHVSISS